jgi:dephospho-CoA kinase
MKARDLNRAEAEQRVQAQPPQAEKIARADEIIDTSGTLMQTREQVREAWARFVFLHHRPDGEDGKPGV